ncbi:MAG: hypothetical protein GY696_14535 [Gammaproteobacteria bacterium]|nr:hypothetical protein [Gammaproteobacteria bacterium]
MLDATPGNVITCYTCGQQGHMAIHCPSKGQQQPGGGAAPAVMGQGRAAYLHRAAAGGLGGQQTGAPTRGGAYQQPRFRRRNSRQVTCFGA